MEHTNKEKYTVLYSSYDVDVEKRLTMSDYNAAEREWKNQKQDLISILNMGDRQERGDQARIIGLRRGALPPESTEIRLLKEGKPIKSFQVIEPYANPIYNTLPATVSSVLNTDNYFTSWRTVYLPAVLPYRVKDFLASQVVVYQGDPSRVVIFSQRYADGMPSGMGVGDIEFHFVDDTGHYFKRVSFNILRECGEDAIQQSVERFFACVKRKDFKLPTRNRYQQYFGRKWNDFTDTLACRNE